MPGTWTSIASNGTNGGPLFLMTDGSVLMNECAAGYGTRRWWKLTPDASGSYASGGWTRIADSANGRKYFASSVLADGRLLVCGGEYSDTSGADANDDTSASEIYDPVADAWSPVTPPPGIAKIGDSPCCMLPDGRFLLGSFNSTLAFLRDPVSGAWSAAGINGAKGDSGSEETWVLMADGSVVVPQCTNSPNAEIYAASLDSWVAAEALQAPLVETASLEIGPGLLLTDGRAFFVGATSNTALYQPGADGATPGTWSAGPPIPQTADQKPQGAKDAPAALLPSGRVLFAVAPVDGVEADYLPPTAFYEFDGANIVRANDPPNANCPTYGGRLLLLPTGQILWVREDDPGFYIYTEQDAPPDAFRPVITSAPTTPVPGATITVSGGQFNGLSQAVSYGDDYAAATNYPLARITNRASGTVRYCRTANHAVVVGGVTQPSMGVATGAATISTQVTIPADIEVGDSDLVVVANGIPSIPVQVHLAASTPNSGGPVPSAQTAVGPKSSPSPQGIVTSTSQKEAVMAPPVDTGTKQSVLHDKISRWLALIVTMGFFALIFILIFLPNVTVQAGTADQGIHNLLFTLLGVVATGWTTIISFYFGSSAGSAQKTQALTSALTNKTP